MKSRLLNIWENIRSSYWMIPSLVAFGSAVLAFFMITLDESLNTGLISGWEWIYTRDAAGARNLLQTVAGSMITVAGVVFSITIVVLTLASSQFGTRVLRNFLRDRGSQWVLGSFIGTFIYSLLILRTVRGGDDGFVPHLSILVSTGLAITSIALLIYFIHHVIVSIQSATVVARMAEDLQETIHSIFPSSIGSGPPRAQLAEERRRAVELLRETPVFVKAKRGGYLQQIDKDTLLSATSEHNWTAEVLKHPGDYIVPGMSLLGIRPTAELTEKEQNKIRSAFLIGAQRTYVQDVRFGLQQLTLVAARALSPGINDPVTANQAIDRIAEALVTLSHKSIPSAFRYDSDNTLRVVAYPFSFSDLADTALTPIRQYARGDAGVTVHTLRTLADILPCLIDESDRKIVQHHISLLAFESRQELSHDADRQTVQRHYEDSQAA